MKRIKWLAQVMVLLVMIFSIGCKSGNQRYNVLFIAVDDLRPELGCYGNEQIISPNIDRLASAGVVFERAYCQSPICMSSRSSLLTGCYPITHRLYSNLSVNELAPEVETMNKLFEKNGYEVCGIGKIYHHDIDHQNQFINSWIDPHEQNVAKYNTQEALNQVNDKNYGPAWEIGNTDDPIYADEYTADWVKLKLPELKKQNKPFFLAVGFYKPHLPFNAPRKYWDLYNHEEIPLTNIPDYPKNGSAYGYHNSPEIRHYTNIPKGNEPIDDETARMLKHGYYACISYIDSQIGQILQVLDEQNMTDNTIIVLWGDHGWKFGDHGMWCKHTNFDLDAHVPLIISAPGFVKNARAKSLVEFVDIYPTLAELCNLEMPDHLHGKSLKPALENPNTMIKEAVFTIWPTYQAPRTDPEKAIIGFSVRTDHYRYTEWIHNASDEILDRELYDHSIDSKENINVIQYSKYSSDIKRLSKLIKDYRTTYKE
jgi:iduronate 2-sulfatase